MQACSSGGRAAQAEQPSDSTTANGSRIVNVVVTPVAESEFVDYVRVVGEVEALYDVTLSAEESGPVESFAVPKGSRVDRGELIAKLDDRVLAAQVREARETADLAQETYERQRRLWEEEHIGSEIAFLQSRSAAAAAAARLETLKARLENTEIRAPVAGVFDEKFVEEGEMVAAGTPVARVVSTGQMKITGGVPERFALDIVRGDSVTVTFDVLPGRRFRGRIRYVGTTVDAQNRTIPIEAVLPNPEGLIKSRMVANLEVERRRLRDVVVVSQDLVQRTEDGFQVFVVATVGNAPVALARRVWPGSSYANQVVIDSGLTVGDSLITSGHRLVDDGTRVRIVGAPGATDAPRDAADSAGAAPSAEKGSR
jgi:RND family efflux transporter MFP subunit